MPTLISLHHVAIICSNYKASREFYTEVVGLKAGAENYRTDRNSYKLDLYLNNEYVVELFSFPEAPSRPSYPEACGLRHLAFAVEDLDGYVRELKTKGVSAEPLRIDPYTGKRFTFFNDPDNLPIELYEK